MGRLQLGRRALRSLDSFINDCVHGIRALRLNPSFSIAVIATLAVGIGATTAVFTVANAILLRPLTIPEPGRAVVLQSTNPREGTSFTVAEGVFTDWRERSRSFETMAGAWNTVMVFSGKGQPHEVPVVKATAGFFIMAGLRPLRGQLFDSSAERPGQDHVAVLDEGFWRREFAAAEGVVGGQIRLDDEFYTVAGVVPSGFSLGGVRRADVWVPLAASPHHRGGGPVTVLARLRTGISVDAAQSEMNAIHERVRQEHAEDAPFGVGVRAVRDWVVGASRPVLIVVIGAVAILMLMCCVNIANMLLARASSRQREFAIRVSLGGSRARIARQLITENLALAFMGGLLGLLLAGLLVRAVPYIHGLDLPRLNEIHPDARMLLIAVCVTIASGLLFGLVPAWHDSSGSSRPLLGAIGAAETITPGAMRLRRSLIVAQLGLSLMLLCGAGLLLNSFVRLTTLELGFSKANVIGARINLPYKQYDSARSLAFYRRLMDRVRAFPGVLDVSAADYLPLQPVLFPFRIAGEGGTTPTIEAMARHADPNYFRVLGVPMIAGRKFGSADDARSPVPVVLNAEAARRLFGRERDAIGRILSTNYPQPKVDEVVGVAANVRQLGLRQDPGPQIYLPLKLGIGGCYIIVRTAPNAGDLSNAIRDATYRLDAAVPAPDVSSIQTWYEREIAEPRAYLVVVARFAVGGLVIAGTGVYGVVAFSVSRRTREFGLRLALGAEPRDILQSVAARESLPIFAWIAVGTAAALWAGRLLMGLLYKVRPRDVPTLIGCAALLTAIASLACYLPARRAMRLDPAAALRDE